MTRARLKDKSREDLEDLVLFYEDVLGIQENLERVQCLRKAFGLPPGPTWLLSRLVAADGRLFRRDALIDYLPATDDARDRDDRLIDVYMVRIRKAVGHDGIETAHGIGWRLTPLGRLRVKRAIGQEAV